MDKAAFYAIIEAVLAARLFELVAPGRLQTLSQPLLTLVITACLCVGNDGQAGQQQGEEEGRKKVAKRSGSEARMRDACACIC